MIEIIANMELVLVSMKACLWNTTYLFHKKQRILGLYFKIIIFGALRVSYEFLKCSLRLSMFTSCSPVNIPKNCFLKLLMSFKLFQCFDINQVPSK